MKYLFNALIVPVNFDKYKKAKFSLELLDWPLFCEELKKGELEDVVSHDATVELINEKCGTNFVKKRKTVFMEPGDVGLHFFLKERVFEKDIETKEELERIGYWLVKSTFKASSKKKLLPVALAAIPFLPP